MKKANKLLGIALVCLSALSFSVCDNPFNKPHVADTERGVTGSLSEHSEQLTIYSADIELITQEMFGDVKIASDEPLYNLDESPVFIYVDFEDYG